MPRAAAFRCGIIGELHRQLSWASDEARIRLIDAAALMVREIDINRAYPVEFITYRLTGWKSDPATAVESVAGEALLTDLVTMVQRISRRVPVDASGRAGDYLGLDDVAHALGVSRRTLVRVRSRGLLMRYGRTDAGALRLVCTRETLAWFQAAQGAHIAGREPPETAPGAIIELARAVGPLPTMQAVVREIAPQCPGRSQQAIRSVLRRAAASGALSLPGRGRLSSREGWLVARGQWRGISAEDIAHRLGVSSAAAHRAALRWRADRLRAAAAVLERCACDGPDSDALLASEDVRAGLPPWSAAISLESAAQQAAGPNHLAATHMLMRRATRCVSALPSQPGAAAVDRIETDLRWITRLRWRLMVSMSAEVHRAVLTRLGRSPASLPGDVQRAVLRRSAHLIGEVLDRQAVDAFDRLHARVHVAVDQMLAGMRAVDPGHASARHTAAVSLPLASVARWPHLLPDARWPSTLCELGGDQAEVCQARWGFGGRAPATLAEIAEARRVSGQKVAAIYAAAHRNLVLKSRSADPSGSV